MRVKFIGSPFEAVRLRRSLAADTRHGPTVYSQTASPSIERSGVSSRGDPARRTFYETGGFIYNDFYAVRSLLFACLGPSAGSGVVHGALLYADRAAGAGLASHLGRPHHADLGSDGIG